MKDRAYWVDLIVRIASPVLSLMSENRLKKDMPVEFSPNWDNRNREVAYLEAFGRTFAGISPWLSLPDDASEEGIKRTQVRGWCMSALEHAVDPQAPDCLMWAGEPQVLVDSAYLANGFIRSYDQTWKQLDRAVQKRYIRRFKELRNIRPFYSNWLLFRDMIEAFLLLSGEDCQEEVLLAIVKKINEWYVGDGWYCDGPDFAFDYYNSFVIHPMLVEILEVCDAKGIKTPVSSELAWRRMQRYNECLERLVSPEATFPPIGRSITYRLGVFQTLALAVWKERLPDSQSYGQIRNLLTHVMKRMFDNNQNFTDQGFLSLGFCGHYPELADYYTNTGSLYMTTLSFLPLGLLPTHAFWTAKPEEWTSLKAWGGLSFPKDYKRSIKELRF